MFQFQLNPTAIKQQKQQLSQQELANFANAEINSLISHRTLFCDELLIQLFQHFQLDNGEIALVAVGGYGRQEMFPLSDLDFLILSEQPLNAEQQNSAEQLIQFLWDCGFDVGASVRTVAECESEGKKDITIATNLLESRLLSGCAQTFQKLTAVLQQPDFWARETFFNAKIEEKNQRYQRYHNTSYNLEPDLKYSPGGLRDLHLIYWIALRHSNAMSLHSILQSGFIYPEEYARLQQAQQFLFKVRFALHLILKRYDNRLLFDRQIKVAQLLGYQGEGNQAVEQMMKDFFQTLATIRTLSEILTTHYQQFLRTDENHIQNAETFCDEVFSLKQNHIILTDENAFQRQPERILDLFYYLTQYPTANIHGFTLRKLHSALRQLRFSLCELPAAREKFLRIFAQPNAIARALVPMHKYGVLTAYLPQWKGIEGLMQFDFFHIYSVDEHSLQVMLKLESFLSPDAAQAHPICHRIFSDFSDRTLLYLAALFHDIAKGRGGDHAELGAVDMREFAQLHGFNRREIDTMCWLVQQHLLMSVVAQRRDIHDPEVVREFAQEVKNSVRLDLLTCLTVADICATNRTLWNSWKRSLFASLYQSCLQQFEGTDCLLDNQQKMQHNRQQALALLQSANLPLDSEQLQRLWARCPSDYFLRNRAKELLWHAELLQDFEGDVRVKVSNRFSDGGTQVFVYCKDQPNLFYKAVSCIGAKKLSIHDALIATTLDGYAMDSFIVTELDGSLVRHERRRLLEESLLKALQTEKLPNARQTPNPKLAHFRVKTEVRFLKLSKKEQTEMELFALDKAGLLAEVSQIFAELKLNLINAKITTIGARAEDFFILTNQQNQALSAEERERLEQRLREELG